MEQTGIELGPGGVPKGSQTHEFYRTGNIPQRMDNPGYTTDMFAGVPGPSEETQSMRPTGVTSIEVVPRQPPRREPGRRIHTVLNVPGTPVAPWAQLGSGQRIVNNPGNVIATCSYPVELPAGFDYQPAPIVRPYDENGEFHRGGIPKGAQTHQYYRLSESLPNHFDNPEWFQGYGGKKQHPMYITTSSSYGSKPPTVHTVPTQFHARSQKFSEHLGLCGMYRNHSLNTEADKSKV